MLPKAKMNGRDDLLSLMHMWPQAAGFPGHMLKPYKKSRRGTLSAKSNPRLKIIHAPTLGDTMMMIKATPLPAATGNLRFSAPRVAPSAARPAFSRPARGLPCSPVAVFKKTPQVRLRSMSPGYLSDPSMFCPCCCISLKHISAQ